MQEPKHDTPFKPLGSHLKYLREQLSESVAEAAGAVEIDIENLERIEQGVERPSEEVLMLLISHFGMQDTDAVQLWELAGYSRAGRDGPLNFQEELQHGNKPVIMLLAVDMRTQYTDGVQISGDRAGIVMNFTQVGGQNRQLPVARVGMSIEQAEVVLKDLQQALLRARYQGLRALPHPKDQHTDQ